MRIENAKKEKCDKKRQVSRGDSGHWAAATSPALRQGVFLVDDQGVCPCTRPCQHHALQRMSQKYKHDVCCEEGRENNGFAASCATKAAGSFEGIRQGEAGTEIRVELRAEGGLRVRKRW